MDGLNSRFKQEGGNVYQEMNVSKQGGGGGGGGSAHEGGGQGARDKPILSPRSVNWKKKYLIVKMERDNLKKENESLRKKLKKQMKQ